nr:MAG TPA: hypothetical protein [Caudoviricetes sp.]
MSTNEIVDLLISVAILATDIIFTVALWHMWREEDEEE